MKLLRFTPCLIVLAGATSAWAASPCAGVDRGLASQRKVALARKIAKQLQVKTVDVLQSFRTEGLSIIYVDAHESDETYLFYDHDPLRSRYVTLWSGAAMTDEEQEIEAWTIKNAAGIPQKLAGCFAWHVTKNRDR